MKVYIDGTLCNKEDAKISVFDHGLLYGDGVFEGIRAYGGRVFLCREHLDRLFEGAHYLCLDIPMSKEDIEAAIYETMRANDLADCYIRLIVTRGVGDLGLNPFLCKPASVIIITASIALYPPELYETGLEIITAATPQIHPEVLNPRIKSLNYLNNIAAKIEALRAGVQEAILLNHLGHVCECTGDNIFIVKDGVLKTPPPSAGLLEGCTRNLVLQIARDAGIDARETTLQRYDLYNADECFLTGTAAELIAVVKIDGRAVADAKPGPLTQDLLARFRRRIAEG